MEVMDSGEGTSHDVEVTVCLPMYTSQNDSVGVCGLGAEYTRTGSSYPLACLS